MFVEDVRKEKGERFAEAWLGKDNCEFTETAVFTWGSVRSRLLREVGHLCRKHSIAIVYDEDAGRDA